MGFQIDLDLALSGYVASVLVNLEVRAENPVRTRAFLSVQNDVGLVQLDALQILGLLKAGGADFEDGSPALRLGVDKALGHLTGVCRQVSGRQRRLAPGV